MNTQSTIAELSELFPNIMIDIYEEQKAEQEAENMKKFYELCDLFPGVMIDLL